MKKICLNIAPLAGNITGIERCLYENVKRIDSLVDGDALEIELLCPEGVALKLPVLRNLKRINLKANGKKIDYFSLRKYLCSDDRIYFSIHGGIPPRHDAVMCINDMRTWKYKEFDSLSFRMKCNINAASCKLMGTKIVTISETARSEISSNLHIPEKKISIISPGWEHIKDFKPEVTVWNRIPTVKPGTYYYSLSSRAPHKNFKWVEEVAKRHPELTFVVGGKQWIGDQTDKGRISNVHYMGYVSDEENVELMMHCKAFLHPSKYEGFGMTPLEALACDATVCVSNASCLPEVFGNTVHYFDPDDYELDLDSLLKQPIGSSEKILQKYTWENSSRKWYELMKEKSQV